MLVNLLSRLNSLNRGQFGSQVQVVCLLGPEISVYSGSEVKLVFLRHTGEMVCILTHESALRSDVYFFFPLLLALGLGVRSGV